MTDATLNTPSLSWIAAGGSFVTKYYLRESPLSEETGQEGTREKEGKLVIAPYEENATIG